MQEFKLEDQEYIALCDLLKLMGFCDTGGQAKIAIIEGQVKVDGEIETRKRCKIRAGSIVEISGEKIRIIKI